VENRDATDDQVTIDSANATKAWRRGEVRHDHAQKTRQGVQLKQMWKSPNGTIRNILDGTIFRGRSSADVPRLVQHWDSRWSRATAGDQYRRARSNSTAPAR
jgi:isocitrate dehydrogenase